MKRLIAFVITSFFFLTSVVPLLGAEQKNTANPPSSSPKPRVVNDLYPGLATGVLADARASELPKGVLLKTGRFVIRDRELNEEIAKAPEEIRPKLRKHAFFILEQIARFKLLQAEATSKAAESGKDISTMDEEAMIQEHLRRLVKTVSVTDAEIQNFFNDNTDMLKGASLTQIKPQIEQFLLQQKQQEFITTHIRALGRSMQMTISAPWLKVQASRVRDNPVDKARTSEKPSLVDFGSTDCMPCKMMAPILETLRKKYKGKLNVLFVHVQEEPILAARYGVQSIPVQVFFDRSGTEVYRHVGFLPQNEIEKQLSGMGVE
jgi:thiol-disulfide isomerase/thioredoxin